MSLQELTRLTAGRRMSASACKRMKLWKENIKKGTRSAAYDQIEEPREGKGREVRRISTRMFGRESRILGYGDLQKMELSLFRFRQPLNNSGKGRGSPSRDHPIAAPKRDNFRKAESKFWGIL
jgi:hypothetical protein